MTSTNRNATANSAEGSVGDARGVREPREQPCPHREHEHGHRRPQPQDRVALHQVLAPDQLEDQHADDDRDGDHLDALLRGRVTAPATITSPRSAAGGAGSLAATGGRCAKQRDEHGQQHLDHVVDRLRGGDRRGAGEPGTHQHRDLAAAQAVCVHQQDRLDLGVVVRVVAREQLDAPAVGHAKARGRVGHALAGDHRHHAREQADADAPGGRGAIAVARGLAGSAIR